MFRSETTIFYEMMFPRCHAFQHLSEVSILGQGGAIAVEDTLLVCSTLITRQRIRC